IIRKNISIVINFTIALLVMLMLVAPQHAMALSSPIAESKNIELLRSDYKVIEGKMKVTADVRVQEGEKVSLLAIGYDKSGNIIEMKSAGTHIFSGNTHVFQLSMDNGEQLDKVDV